MNKLCKKTTLWSVLTAVFAVLFIAVCIGSPIADYYAAAINSYFNCKTFELVEDEFAELEDKTYYKHKFANADGTADKEALYAYDKQVAREVNNEGSVLLWNNGALPLSDKAETINFFGGRSYNYFYVTDGSGGVRMSESPKLKASFEKAGYKVNEKLWNFYSTHSYNGDPKVINETAWQNEMSAYVDGGVGVYVLARKGSEGCDLYMSGSDGENGNLTALSQAERDHITNLIALKNSGKLSKVVLVLNTVSMGVQFDFISRYKEDIDACIWVGLGGTSGPDSVCDLLSGKVTPSGKLSDTFVYNSFSAPSTVNSGDYDFANASAFSSDSVYQKLLRSQGKGDSTEKNLKYLVYAEGIYVGYRYYETRYEDVVMSEGGADATVGSTSGNAWKYSEEVAFPFGYGLSYTTFEWSDYKVKENADSYTVSVTVKNVGETYSGKDVVQVYLQKPYTVYARDNGIEQSSVNLVGFVKTKLLSPGESETVDITVRKSELKTYDANNAKTYILDGGKYYLTAASDAHKAVNNILAKKGYTGDAEGKTDFVSEYTLQQNLSVTVSSYTGKEIVNRFDDVDINKTDYGAGNVTYLSRKDWKGTYPSVVTLKLTSKLLAALDYGKSWTEDEFDTVPTYEAKNGLTLFSLWKDTKGNELPYDHKLWEDLLDMTTFEEQTYLVCNAWCATQELVSVSAPATANRDGPAGLNYLPDGKVIGLGMCYPSENIVASTFNTKLAYDMGECIGEDNFACGFTFIYAPGANTHRNAFGGRNGEYYSEDSYLSALMCESEVKGIQCNGSGAQAKHFALNDMEINRNGVCVWANEQSVREIYIKAFEFACAKGRGEMLSVMSAFNRVGALWSGAHRGLMTDVLRGEWGFTGFVQSDGNGYQLMANYVDGLRAGNDTFMCGGGKKALDKYKNSPAITLAMREATHRVMYAVSRTHAMNGLSASTKVVSLTPWWRTTIDGMMIGFGVLTVAAAGMLITSIVLKKKAAKQAAIEE